MKRLASLDYLRGLAAFGIMIYHYLSWTLGRFSADTFLGRLGVYGVSIFYVLSGLTLYYVYFNKMQPNLSEVVDFFKKRVLRIFPLLWLVTFAAIAIQGSMPNLGDLALNLTGLFGFVKWDTYYSTGIWSIGNELVFYVFFPFFVLFSKSSKWLMTILSAVIFGLFVYFAFFKLDVNTALSDQWRDYINPLNQVFLFLGGYLMGLFLDKVKVHKVLVYTSLIVGVVIFMFYPVHGDTIHLVTGVNRLIFTLCCLLISFSFFKMDVSLPNFVHKPLTILGEASYSVYLLHPVVYKLTGLLFVASAENLFHTPESVRLVTSVILTLVGGYFVYQYFEKYFMRLGRKVKSNPVV